MEPHAQAPVALSLRRRDRVPLAALLLAVLLLAPRATRGQQSKRSPESATNAAADTGAVVASGDSVAIHLVDADLRAAVEALAPYLDRPVVFGSNAMTARVTLTTPRPVARRQIIGLLRGMLESQQFELVSDSAAGLYRVRAIAPASPEPGASASPAPGAGQDTSGPVQLYMIQLRHARAADVAATVNALFGQSSALGEPGASRPSTLGQQLTANQVPPSSAPAPSPAAVPGLRGRVAKFQGEVTIVPDARTNSLLIRAGPSDFALIQAAVRSLDTRPLQVLIEVVIAELQTNRQFSFGVDASLPPTRVGGSKSTATVSGSQLGLGGAGDLVLQVMHLGPNDITATLAAAAERGDVHILSQPVVLAENNQQATINVGSQRPFVQVSRSLPTDAASRDQVVQYEDVGTKLTVQPTISPDGYVMLSVTQEVNNATGEVAFNAPVISTRSVQTQLLIKDGQTVALGGLTDQQRDVTQSGIPLLSGIPWLGGLFGRTSRQTSETELFLFLTPHVIRTDQDADSLTAPLRDRAKGIRP